MNTSNIQAAINKLKQEIIRNFGNDVKIIHFGSSAHGKSDSESDIDILVLIPGKVDNRIEEKVFNMAFDIEIELDVIFGIIVYSLEFWNSGRASVMPLHQNIEREGIVI